ncbi:MAG: radical SAM protein [Polyangiaceae bacterium]|nr:radical SAM protein [Polyangiaceae bacterium]MCE7889404.1 radical SAM protein [Sorangiineae bacterium PRO1]MCL4753186.1 radical SAM protein [Myxococcales bacterium]
MSRLPQAEIKLGELCNNRCVFCISGHLTSEKRAPLVSALDLKERVRQAHESGVRRITLLGGEPTIQPAFREVVEYAVGLGFDEIVIFSNGSRTGHTRLMDEVLASGGQFEWRFSFQGGNREAHERTTGRKGSFRGLLESLERAAEREQKVTINCCVVNQNYDSLPDFPELLAPYAIAHVHIDMLHPGDLPEPKKGRLGELMPRYSELVEPLRRMVRGFPPDLERSIGNLPFCIAPDLSPFIQHGGEETWVVGASDTWNKYDDKTSAKTKLPACEGCALSPRCGGVYRAYLELHGDSEIVAIPPDTLAPELALPTLSPRLARRLERLRERAPFGRLSWLGVEALDSGRELRVRFRSPRGETAELSLVDGPAGVRGGYRVEDDPSRASDELRDGLAAILDALGQLGRSGVVAGEQRRAKSLAVVGDQ